MKTSGADAGDNGSGSAETTQRYRAPALDKGLDILELLARSPQGLTLGAIVQRLERSQGELFRMVQVLQHRGYIDQPGGSAEFQLTDKLFLLAMEQPRNRSLVELALPRMRELALELGQSCHLAFHADGEMVVVARMESGGQIGFSVRVGYRCPLLSSGSGLVLMSFQPPEVRAHWRSLLRPRPTAEQWRLTIEEMAEITARGFANRPSSVVEAVRDISAPLMRGDCAAAAITVPFLPTKTSRSGEADIAQRLVLVAEGLSKQLVTNDNRA